MSCQLENHIPQYENLVLNADKNVSLNALTLPVGGEFAVRERPAMIICPGGGYTACSDREAEVIAYPYLKAGYQCFVLRYTVTPDMEWPQPLDDFKQAYGIIVNGAKKWHINTNKIATIGFSAGGHLAAMAAVDKGNNLAAAMLIYPAILQNMLDLLKPGLPEPSKLVNEHTCPCFLAACRDDRTVSIKNTLAMQQALVEHDIPFESHIYSYGGHAFASADPWSQIVPLNSRVAHWIPDSLEWLKETVGELTPNGINKNAIHIGPTADRFERLSAFCSLEKVQKSAQPDIEKVLSPIYEKICTYANSKSQTNEQAIEELKHLTLAEIGDKLGIPIEVVCNINSQLIKLSTGGK